jgi:hypothetical protein
MAVSFGDQGDHVITIDGIPFRAPGATRDEAKQSVVTMLSQYPGLLDERAKRLGLTAADQDALRTRHLVQREQLAKGQASDPDVTLRGKARPTEALEGMGVDPSNMLSVIPFVGKPLAAASSAAGVRIPMGKTPIKALVGAGRTFREQAQGARQLMAGLVGDDEAIKEIFAEDKMERELFDQLDAQSIGAEDVGQLAPIMLEFMLPGAAGANGLKPLILTGAALGAAEVEKDPTFGSRATSAGIGAAGAAVPAAGAKVLGSSMKSVAGAAVNLASKGRLYFHGLRAGGNTTKLVDEALGLLDDPRDGMQYLGRAALDKVQSIVRTLPKAQADELAAQGAEGVVMRSLANATTTRGGVNVFNATEWEKSMTELTGRYVQTFGKDAANKLLAINAMGRQMQRMQALGVNVTPESAQAAARALIMAPAEAEALVAALSTAESVAAKQAYFSALVDRGVAVSTGAMLPLAGNQTVNKVETTYDRSMEQIRK